jgi:hypothetical protein
MVDISGRDVAVASVDRWMINDLRLLLSACTSSSLGIAKCTWDEDLDKGARDVTSDKQLTMTMRRMQIIEFIGLPSCNLRMGSEARREARRGCEVCRGREGCFGRLSKIT